jgi:hypothetical protein
MPEEKVEYRVKVKCQYSLEILDNRDLSYEPGSIESPLDPNQPWAEKLVEPDADTFVDTYIENGAKCDETPM